VNADTQGDVCDTDDDNDLNLDGQEPLSGGGVTDPYNPDTDGDRCMDGVELLLGSVPTSFTSKCPAAIMTSVQQAYFRACHWNLPPNGYDGNLWDAESDGTDNDQEMDLDADGVNCPQTSLTQGDADADNGSSSYVNKCLTPPCKEIADSIEIKGYNTLPSSADTDGDTCEDWIEISDVNGDRAANASDRTLVIRRVFDLEPADPVSDPIMDVNKDGAINAGDAALVTVNSSLVKSPGGTCLVAPGTPSSDVQRSLP
jgi:hypothetical protein